ncbi:MAG: protein kinase [Gemmataceae bacterium]|nr:protein kinase [Gemmataceae bacterium]
MSQPMPCPEPAQLRQLLANELSARDEADLVEHMDGCPACPSRLQEMAAGDPSLVEAVRYASGVRPPGESAYWPALEMFERPVDQTAAGPDTTPDDDDLALDFLTPSKEPGHLGRLNHYDIVRVIGRGGMGVVLHAFDTHLQRQVALKVMSPDLAKDETARKRFCREARAAAAITDEHVVAVHQVAHEEERDVPFLVMQLVTGESLERRLERTGPLPLREIVRIGMQVASGLAAAHSHDLIHRDIKPDNILLEAPGDRVKLTDFGLARAAEDVKLTASGMIAGTPAYMSPEQAKGEPLDHRSDLFSFGSVLYAMCTGHPPFDGNSSFVVLRKITEEAAKPVSEINPQIPGWLAAIVDRLLAKEPAERFQSAKEVADLLRNLLARLESAEAAAIPICPMKYRKRAWWAWGATATTALLATVLVLEVIGVVRLAPVGPLPAVAPGPDTPSAALRSTLNGNAGPVWSLALSPDDASAAMAIDDGTVKVWDVKAGRVKSTINAHKGPVWSVAFSNDGALLATASDDGAVKLWNAADGKELKSMPHAASVRSIAFGPAGRLVTGSRNGNVRIWDTAAGKETVTTKGHTHMVTMVAFSSDGKSVASASGDKTVKLWDAGTGQEQLTLTGHTGGVYAVAFSPDGTKVATGGWDKTVRVWDVGTGDCMHTLQGHRQDVWAVAFAPDGQTIASASEDHTVKLWNASSGAETMTLHGHTGTVYSIAFSREKRVMTGGRDGTLRLWDIAR